jgi:hypothetical protein
MPLRAPAPQAGASANSATRATLRREAGAASGTGEGGGMLPGSPSSYHRTRTRPAASIRLGSVETRRETEGIPSSHRIRSR